MTETLGDYLSRISMEEEKRKADAASLTLGLIKDNPDEVANDMKLADEFSKINEGIRPPVPVVKQNRSFLQQQVEMYRARTYLNGTKSLSEWIADPENAALSKDDLENLSWWDGFVRGAYGTYYRSKDRLSVTGNQFMLDQTAGRNRDRKMTFVEILQDASRSSGITDMEGNPIRTWHGGELLSAIGRWVDARYADFIGTDDEAAANEYAKALGEASERIKKNPKSVRATAFQEKVMVPTESFTDALSNFAKAFYEDPIGGFAWMFETAGESLPQMVAALGVTALTRNPASGAVAMGAGSYLTERYSSPIEFFEEKGLNLTKPDDVQRLLSDPQLMKEAADRGVIRGLVIGAVDMLSVGVAGVTISKNPLVDVFAQGVAQAVSGGTGEYLARVAAGQEMDYAEVLAEAFAEFATAPIDMATAGRSFVRARKQASEAEHRKKVIEEVTNNAVASKLRERMPEKFREFLEKASEASPHENMYIPADAFEEYFQSSGVDPYEIIDNLDGVSREDFDLARAAGADFKIPTATYAAKIAGSEYDKFFQDHAKFDPDEMTAERAARFNEIVAELQQEAYEEQARIWREFEATKPYYDEVRETVVSRFREAGYAAEVSQGLGELYARVYTSLAERTQMTMDEFMKRYAIPAVRGDRPDGVKFKTVDALTRTLAEARNRRAAALEKRGPTLLEFIHDYGGIHDPGGELKARDAAVIKRGRGKKALKLLRDDSSAGGPDMFGSVKRVDEKGRAHGVDDVALAAIEAGYMHDHPVVRQYLAAMERGDQVPDIAVALWDSIDEELRGNSQYAFHDTIDENRAENEKFHDEFERYLASLGVSLDDPDDVIRAAIEKDYEERRLAEAERLKASMAEAEMYLQSGEINTESEAFKRWFGDSKVVDDQGKPLVVYHGGVAGIEAFDPDRIGSAWDVGDEIGFFFTTERGDYPGTADDYARRAERNEGSGEVYPVYLKIENPYTLEQYAQDIGTTVDDLMYYGGDLQSPIYVFDEGRDEIVNRVKAGGFDGIAFHYTADDGTSAGLYVALEPTQIKSVYNRGTFDPNDARIMYQSGGYVVDGVHYRIKPPKKLYRGTVEGQQESGASGLGTAMLGRGLYTSRSKSFAKMYATNGKVEEVPIEAGWPRNPLVLHGTGGAPSLFNDWILRNTEYRNIREFNKDWPDPAEFVRSKGYDGVIAGDEVVRYPDVAGDRILYQGGYAPRGSILLPEVGADTFESIINLYKNADKSTGLHESAHLFLRIIEDLAYRGDEYAANEIGIIRNWWRENAKAVAADANKSNKDAGVTADDVIKFIDTGTTHDLAKDRAINVGMHEQWARGFERYMMEGVAPVPELKSLFHRFMKFLISVYQYIAKLNVEISPEMREVFDRLVATDEQLAAAREDAGERANVFATAEQLGMTDEEFARFLKLKERADAEAMGRLIKKTIEPVRIKTQKWYKEERNSVRSKVESEVNAWRVYRAYEWLANGRWLGDGAPEQMPPMKLPKKWLVDVYGAGVLETLPQRVYSPNSNLDPEEIAGWFGYSSADQMVQDLEKAPPRKQAIEAETDRRMYEKYGDPLNDGHIEELALQAIHNDMRGHAIAAEYKALLEVVGDSVGFTLQEARAAARQPLSRMQVRDAMNAKRFLSAERRAGEEYARYGRVVARDSVWMNAARSRVQSKARAAMRGKGSFDAVAGQIDTANKTTLRRNEAVQKMLDAKRRQLLNHALYMESVKIADEVAKAERYVKRLNSKSARERIAFGGRDGGNYLAAIDDLLFRYDFRKMSGAAEERREGLAAFIQQMKDEGRENEIAIPDKLLEDTQRKPYKRLSIDELRDVIDSLKNIENAAKRANELIDAERERVYEETVSGVVEEISSNLKKVPQSWAGTKKEKLANSARQFLNVARFAETILREFDGFKDFGRAFDALKADIDAAQSRLIMRKEKATKDIEKLYSVYSKEEQRKMSIRKYIPALGESLSKWELIAIALNTGNEGNYERLTSERAKKRLTEEQVQYVLSSLDERDARFVQSVWDYLDTFRPDIAARERRVTGVEPRWVEGRQVEIGGRLLRGGYYPIKYDPRLSSNARDDAMSDIVNILQAGRFSKAQTRNGHLKERGNAGDGRSLLIDMSVLHNHVNQVIYDLELSEPVSNAWRILHDPRVRTALEDSGRIADFDALERWLLDTGSGELRNADILNEMARAAKSNFTSAKLAFNISTVLLQVTGIAQSAVVVGKRNMAHGIIKTMANPSEASAMVAEMSPFMRTRQTTFNKDIYDFYNDPKVGKALSRWGEFKQNVIGRIAFWPMTKVQYHLVDVPTWIAAYEQGMSMFDNNEAKAIAHADSVVKRAQASGIFSDRSEIERGTLGRQRQSDIVRMFTALASYMFAKYNIAYEKTAIAGRTIREKGVSAESVKASLSWSVDMVFLFTLEALLFGLIKGEIPPGDDDDDESLATYLLKETAFGVAGSIPVVREVSSTLQGFAGGGSYGAITKELSAPLVQLAQGDVDKAMVKSVIGASGIFTGMPSSQINRFVDAAWREAEGEDVSPIEYLIGKKQK